ncbi:MAG: hypothetical protein K1X33_06510 [Methanobacteriaceae archaeon]|nr:hypothetical protein [Methanobacteriaceae archaeon]
MKKILYKKDSKGKIRIWTIEANNGTLIESSGLKDGKLVTFSKICNPKNIGKKNSTTSVEQAELMMNSKIKDKIFGGYSETEEDLSTDIFPMLAKVYEDYSSEINYENSYVQPKLDGMRCICILSTKNPPVLKSRDGRIIEGLTHITDELSLIKEDIILDGELYAHGLSFQNNMKLIKKYREGETENIKYNVYDSISESEFMDRYLKACSIIKDCKHVQSVKTYAFHSEEEMKRYHSDNISLGYEGSIIRYSDIGYENGKRSKYLLKYKSFQDIAAIIIDILPSEADPKKGVPVLRYNNVTFEAGTAFSHADREDLLTNKEKYINKIGEIRFFEYTDSGKPRFPVLHGIRLDK